MDAGESLWLPEVWSGTLQWLELSSDKIERAIHLTPSREKNWRQHTQLKDKESHQTLTTSPSTRLRTRSPISGEMSLPNCCSVVRKRLSLQSCRAPQAGGSCWVGREAVEEVAGPLLKPLGVEGAPFSVVGE